MNSFIIQRIFFSAIRKKLLSIVFLSVTVLSLNAQVEDDFSQMRADFFNQAEDSVCMQIDESPLLQEGTQGVYTQSDSEVSFLTLYAGAATMVPHLDYMNTPHGLVLGFDTQFGKHHFVLDWQTCFGKCQKDIDARYGDILKGDDYSVSFAMLGYGHDIYSNRFMHIYPYVGMGGGVIELFDAYEEDEELPRRGAFKTSLGILFDFPFKLKRNNSSPVIADMGIRVRSSQDLLVFRKIGLASTYNFSISWYCNPWE